MAEAWKDNLLDELLKEESEVEIVEKLFNKMRNEFGETEEEEKKIEQEYIVVTGWYGRMGDNVGHIYIVQL